MNESAVRKLWNNDRSQKKRPRAERMTSSPDSHHRPMACRLDGDQVVRVDDKFLCSAPVKILIASGGLIQGNDGGVNRSGDLYLVIQDRIHQLTMVAHDGTLSGGEGEGLGPAQTNADTKLTDFGLLVDATWITRHVETRDTQATGSARDRHDRVQYCCRRFTCASAVTARLKTDTVNGCIDLRLTDNLFDHVRKLSVLCEIDGFTAEAARLLESLLNHIADDDDRRAKQLRRGGTGQPYRA